MTLLHPLKPIPVQTWNFEHESVIRIGRSTDNQVVLYSAVVSRHHVELRRVGVSWEIVNLGTNGTYLDGKRITQVPVVDGAIIRLARSGPNIQIRLGGSGVEELPEEMTGDRTVNQKGAPPQIATEITRQQPHAFSHPDGGSLRPPRREAPAPPKGTIPVPPHLRLPLSLPSMGTVSRQPATALIAKPSVSEDVPTQIMKPCTHQRGGTLFCSDCGQPLRMLGKLGAYYLLKILSKGKVGLTYLAWRDGLTLTLKTLHPDWAGDAQARAALECEAEILRQLHHPRLPNLLDYSAAQQPYLVLEFLPGQPLMQRIASRGVLPVQQAIDWLLQICEVLSYLHAFTPPILHRNIQPRHLIYRTRLGVDKIALVGFGAIKAIVLSQSHGSLTDWEAEGDRLYRAPESFDLNATPAADLYSLAPLFAFLLTGKHPVSFCSADEPRCFATDELPGLPPALAAILTTLSHPQPEQRYPTAAALADVLRQVARSL